MKEYVDILTLAADRLLPKTIDSGSSVSYRLVMDLLKEGFLSGVIDHKGRNTLIVNPTITWPGRRFLTEQLRFRYQNMAMRRALGQALAPAV
ncbi:MAG TPA: hypothetical protein VM553_18825 [Dongiaceae bacterium]|nr:hypothetical protein [Dongiaceae bacterium]